MKNGNALAVAAVLVLLLASTPGLAGATTPGTSLAAEFDSSTTNTDTVVVAVGDPATDAGRASLLAANAIANHHDYSVVRVPRGEFPYAVVNTLSHRVQHDGLRNAIVVGVGENNTDAVATALTAVGAPVGDDEVTLDVKDQITGESASDVLYKATLQQWESADAVFLTTTTEPDTAKVSLAGTSRTGAGVPVLAQSSGSADVNATLDYLGASTVYVTPGVSSSTEETLQDEGYTVESALDGVSLDQSLQNVADGVASPTAQDIVVVDESHAYAASQLGVGANSTILVTENTDTLGDAATQKLANSTEVDNVYVLGNDDDVSDDVLSTISNTVRENTSVDRVTRHHGLTELYLRTSLLTSGYEYGVLTTHVNETGETVTVDITNVGYSTVETVDNASVTATWQGDIDTSSPAGEATDAGYVVTNDEAMAPGQVFSVDLEATTVENGGHPELDYYVGSSGALVGASGGVSFFVDHVQGLADWLLDGVQNLLPDVGLDTSNPLVIGAMLVALIAVAVGLLKLFGGGMRARREYGSVLGWVRSRRNS